MCALSLFPSSPVTDVMGFAFESEELSLPEMFVALYMKPLSCRMRKFLLPHVQAASES